MPHSRRSYSMNRGKRRTLFQKGHKYFRNEHQSVKSTERVSVPVSVKRPHSQEFTDALNIMTYSSEGESPLLPTKLRPAKDKENKYKLKLFIF